MKYFRTGVGIALAALVFSVGGCNGNKTTPVTAGFTVSDGGVVEVGMFVSFDASASTGLDGSETFEWDLDGDGTVDTVAGAPTFVYPSAGQYDVTLNILDANGVIVATITVASAVTVLASLNPGGTIGGLPAGTVSAPAVITLDGGTLTAPGGLTITSIAWDWGDGSAAITSGPTDPVSHTYASAGTYTVTASVTYDNGTTGTMTQTIDVSATNVTAYFPPPESAGGWRKLTDPNEIRASGQMDPDKLNAFLSWVLAKYPEPKRNGGVVIRNGWIVAEWYNSVTDPDERGGLKSAGKALTILHMGQVIDDSRAGAFASNPDPRFQQVDWDRLAYDYIPEGWPLSDPRKAQITIRQLAHHVAGIVPEGTPGVTNNPPSGEGFWEFCLGLKPEYPSAALYADPGTEFLYATWDIRHLSLIIKNMTGLRTDEFAKARFFDPCGIENWNMSNRGGSNGQIGPASDVRLFTTAREFARIGYLMLREGVWDGQQILPSWLMQEIHRQPFPGILPDHFRYHWLHKLSTWPATIPDDMFCTYGNGGNMVVIIPSLDLVFSRVGNSYGIDPYATILDVTTEVLAAVIPAP